MKVVDSSGWCVPETEQGPISQSSVCRVSGLVQDRRTVSVRKETPGSSEGVWYFFVHPAVNSRSIAWLSI